MDNRRSQCLYCHAEGFRVYRQTSAAVVPSDSRLAMKPMMDRTLAN